MAEKLMLLPQGDRAISVVFEEEISPKTNSKVLALCRALDSACIPGIVGCVPAYRTLLVEYDPLILTYAQAAGKIRACSTKTTGENVGCLVEIPVCYGGEFGQDLDEVAAHSGLTAQEVIEAHSGREYRVYMLGFRPGFPYLGGLDPRLAMPRRKMPRPCIEGGSVGIAGNQTGIYPQSSPGGWNLIGRTPLTLFDETNRAQLAPGDTLRFIPVDEELYYLVKKAGRWPL